MNAQAAITFHDEHPGTTSLREEVLRGLAARPKAIAPKFFYDQRGSELFDAICEQPEYYPTRTEIGILSQRADEIAGLAGPECLLIELGSGASKKVRLLLESLRPTSYMGVDISRDFLLDATARLAADYPWLDVHAVCADFSQRLDADKRPSAGNHLAFFPGSSIGNFEPDQAVAFMARLRRILRPAGALLIGVDLKKDRAVLDAAYNDSAGVTAEFNLNLLWRIKNELGGDIDVDGFAHRAFYNERAGRVEMHLVSRKSQCVGIAGQSFEFAEGETIHTENSYKYTVDEFKTLASVAGYEAHECWVDDAELFSVHYLSYVS